MTYSTEKYQQRREAALAAQKRYYYEKNKEARQAKQRIYDQEHREQIIQRMKEYRVRVGGKVNRVEISS